MNLIGRDHIIKQIGDNIDLCHHTLLIGPSGIGKTAIIKRIAYLRRRRAIYIEEPKPIKTLYLSIVKGLHHLHKLQIERMEAEYLNWEQVEKRLSREKTERLLEIILYNLSLPYHEHKPPRLLLIERLDGLSASEEEPLKKIIEKSVVVGTVRELTAKYEKLWWNFERIYIPSLEPEHAEEVYNLHRKKFDYKVRDEEKFKKRVLTVAAGNPLAIREMINKHRARSEVTEEHIRNTYHEAGVPVVNVTPILLLAGAFVIATRFLALALNNTDLYVFAGGGYALFMVARFFIYRSMRR